MKILTNKEITSQNVKNSFEKGIYMDTPGNRKKGVVGQQYDIPSEEKIKKTEFKKLEVDSEEMGKKAFHLGIKASPTLDIDFMKIVNKKDKNGELLSHEQRMKMYKAWSNAWHSENVNTAFKEITKKDWKGDKISWRR